MTSEPIDKAVILAAGMGTRMRCSETSGTIEDQQRSVAETGLKTMIPFGQSASGLALGQGRPFLDYVLGRLTDAGYRQVCLVIGPQHSSVWDYYRQPRCDRLSIQFAIQQQPSGTADAVAAAKAFAQQDQFLVVNSDNLYPLDVLRELRLAEGPATAGFDPSTVFHPTQRSDERLAAMAIMRCDATGHLKEIVEKPEAAMPDATDGQIYTSMNCWRFGPAIFEACGRIKPSLRGEYELPSAVQFSMDHLEQTYRIFPSRDCVLDLSRRDDIAKVAGALRAEEIRL